MLEQQQPMIDINVKSVNEDRFPPEYNVQELVRMTSELLPELYVEAFIARQLININLKRPIAWKYINIAAGSAFTSGFTPGPTPVLAGIAQTGLIFALSQLYELKDFTKLITFAAQGSFSSIISDFIQLGFDTLGAAFPPSYWVTSSASGFAAMSVTVVTGISVTTTLEETSRKYVNSSASKEEVENFIKETFKKNFKKYQKEVDIKNKNDVEEIGIKFMNGELDEE